MARRLHVPLVQRGRIILDEREAHHVRDVLRLRERDPVEVFDDAGGVAGAVIARCDADAVEVLIADVPARGGASAKPPIVIASALPKGDRADWMVEKLSELGVDRFIPLAAARSVVLPGGRNKSDRWKRIATEAAKQSRRAGVMRIDELTPVERLISLDPASTAAFVLSTSADAQPLVSSVHAAVGDDERELLLLIGPEGGWTDAELARFGEARLTPVKLTATILRVETAAVAAAAIVAAARDAQGARERTST